MVSSLRGMLSLAENVELAPVSALPNEWRDQLGDAEGEFAISRAGTRSSTMLFDAAAAELIEFFRTPSTIVQAVVAYSRKHNVDAEATLDAALPVLRQLVSAGFLVAESSPEGAAIVATYQPGAWLGPYKILRCVHVLDDSEIYQSRSEDGSTVAVKVARSGHEQQVESRNAIEAAVLRRLAGTASPLLIDHGIIDKLPMLAMSWQSGIDPAAAAAEARASRNRFDLPALLEAIARAYAAVHERGVLHGDVHAGNLLVGRDGSIALVDFGLATFENSAHTQPLRGGVGFFFEPELARVLLTDNEWPGCTAKGEQYSVAALLFLLATDHHYLDFNLVSSMMLAQIATDPPLSFHAAGADPWPELEAVFARALAKEPEGRYPDMAAFADALSSLRRSPAKPSLAASGGGSALVEDMLGDLSLNGRLFADGLPVGPTSSINFGAAGIAYALYRFACGRGDGGLLAAADAWAAKAARDQQRPDAFSSQKLGITDDMSDQVSIYHRSPGVALTRALIARAAGDDYEFAVELEQFATTISGQGRERDLTLGGLGTVLGTSLLLDLRTDELPASLNSMHRTADEQLARVWEEVASFQPIEQCTEWLNLGIAHGWSGLLYTTLRWNEITGTEPSSDLVDRLDQLVECTLARGRGLTVPWREHLESTATMPGWCNGSAGLVQLACQAFETLGDDTMLAVAEGAGWNTWEDAASPLVDLCCGLAGRAYALLALYRVTRDSRWLERARLLADRAARIAPDQRSDAHPRHSLYKGELGLTLLIDELERPEEASMPVFERER